MNVNRCPILAGFAAGAAVLQPLELRARDADAESWIELSASGEIAPGADLRVEVEERFRDGANEAILGTAVDLAVSDALALGGGLEVHDAGGLTEVRPYQQVSVAVGPLSLRTRLEERVFDDADRLGLRLRQRAQFSPAIATGTRARLSAEWFYQIRDRLEGGPRRTDQWRFAAGVQHRLAPGLDLTVSHMVQIRPRPAGQTTHTHVPQLALAYRF